MYLIRDGDHQVNQLNGFSAYFSAIGCNISPNFEDVRLNDAHHRFEWISDGHKKKLGRIKFH